MHVRENFTYVFTTGTQHLVYAYIPITTWKMQSTQNRLKKLLLKKKNREPKEHHAQNTNSEISIIFILIHSILHSKTCLERNNLLFKSVVDYLE